MLSLSLAATLTSEHWPLRPMLHAERHPCCSHGGAGTLGAFAFLAECFVLANAPEVRASQQCDGMRSLEGVINLMDSHVGGSRADNPRTPRAGRMAPGANTKHSLTVRARQQWAVNGPHPGSISADRECVGACQNWRAGGQPRKRERCVNG